MELVAQNSNIQKGFIKQDCTQFIFKVDQSLELPDFSKTNMFSNLYQIYDELDKDGFTDHELQENSNVFDFD